MLRRAIRLSGLGLSRQSRQWRLAPKAVVGGTGVWSNEGCWVWPQQQQQQQVRMLSGKSKYEYDDNYIKGILKQTKTIAMVGASGDWKRPSNFAMKYLQNKGYHVIPVNPGAAKRNELILGEKAYASLKDIPFDIDMVDIFRGHDAVMGITKETIEIAKEKNVKVLWMQLGIFHDEAAQLAESHGLQVVMDRCPKIEYGKLCSKSELGFHGFDTGVITSKRRMGNIDEHDNVKFQGFETKAIHAGCRPDNETGARVTPIYQTSSFVFEDVAEAADLFNLATFGNIYSRLSNPSVSFLAEKVTSLENGVGATCTASGHAAQLITLFTLLQPGDHFVASRNLYGGSITQFQKCSAKFGWNVDFVDLEDREDVIAKLSNPKCKFLWAESLANPGGIVTDLSFLSEECKKVQVPLIIDNTLATPYLCQPKQFGADIVVHSCTKFLNGHGNSLGGCVVDLGTFDWSAVSPDKYPSLLKNEPMYHGINFYETFGPLAFTVNLHAVGLRDLGPCMSPMNAFLTTLGMETLPLRMDRHVSNAKQVAEYLSKHPKIAWVSYAGLEKNAPYYERSMKYMPRGPGSVFTFGLKGGMQEGIKFVESCQLASHLANVGDTRTLILHPGSTTHRQLSDEKRAQAGAGDDVIRISVGIETIDDILMDLEQALAKI